jgi:hypothetical protein
LWSFPLFPFLDKGSPVSASNDAHSHFIEIFSVQSTIEIKITIMGQPWLQHESTNGTNDTKQG